MMMLFRAVGLSGMCQLLPHLAIFLRRLPPSCEWDAQIRVQSPPELDFGRGVANIGTLRRAHYSTGDPGSSRKGALPLIARENHPVLIDAIKRRLNFVDMPWWLLPLAQRVQNV